MLPMSMPSDDAPELSLNPEAQSAPTPIPTMPGQMPSASPQAPTPPQVPPPAPMAPQLPPEKSPLQLLNEQLAQIQKDRQDLQKQIQDLSQQGSLIGQKAAQTQALAPYDQVFKGAGGTAKLFLINLLRGFGGEGDIKSSVAQAAVRDYQEDAKNKIAMLGQQRGLMQSQLQDLTGQQSAIMGQLPYVQSKAAEEQKNYREQTDKFAGLRGYQLQAGQDVPKGFNSFQVNRPGINGAAPIQETWVVPGANYEAELKKVPVNKEMIDALHLVDDKGQPLIPGALVPEELQRTYVTNMASKVSMFKSPQEVNAFANSLVDPKKYPEINGRLGVILTQAASMGGETGNSLARGAITQAQEETYKKENVDPSVAENRAARLELAQSKDLQTEKDKTGGRYQKSLDDISSRLDRVAYTENMLKTPGSVPQAMAIPELLTAVLSGQGSGVRLTTGELNMIGKARGVVGDVQGWMGSLAGTGALGKEQREQMQGILADAKGRLLLKNAINNKILDTIKESGSIKDINTADSIARKSHDAFVNLEPGRGRSMDEATANLLRIAAMDDKDLFLKIAKILGWGPPPPKK